MSDQPIQYQKGWVEFYQLKFKVTPQVLIPRPETELLVDEVLRYTHDLLLMASSQKPKTINIIDIGTGAGAIAISLAKNNPELKIIATDISTPALKVAKQNAKFHQVEDKIKFLESDLLKNVTLRRCDVIVTNLPYIPSARIPYLDSSVKDFEPLIALDGGEDGFELYRKLFQQIKQQAINPKLIIAEIDYTHRELAVLEAQKYFPKAVVEIKTDLHHKQRILKILF